MGDEEPSEWRVRPMTEADLADVLCIERASFSKPWPEESFRYELTSSPASRLLVIEEPQQGVRGYAAAWIVADEMQINNLAVEAHARRRGLGSILLDELLRMARGAGVRTVSLEVRPSNEGALALYQRAGFRPAGRRHEFYRHPTEDGLILTLELDS